MTSADTKSLPAVGDRIRHTALDNHRPEGVVVELRTDKGYKPIVARKDDGTLFYAHADQWETI